MSLPVGDEVSLPPKTPAQFWLEPKFSRLVLQAPAQGQADAWVLFRDAKTNELRANHYLLHVSGQATSGAPKQCEPLAELAGDATPVVGPPPSDPPICTLRWKGAVPELVMDVGGQCVMHVPNVARIPI